VGYDVGVQSEFAYNNSVNRLMGKTHFQTVNGRSPKGVTDLASLPEASKRSADVESCAEHIKEVHE
jgi:hypothetical protein